VRGRDCFVVISTCSPVNDNLMELLIFLDCLRRASAKTVTVVLPYYGYGRQDRKSEGRVPITAKLVANMITAARPTACSRSTCTRRRSRGSSICRSITSRRRRCSTTTSQSIRGELGDLCLVSPDVGNVKVAEGMANLLGGDLAIINKRRLSGSQVEVGSPHRLGEGKTVLMVDDMISTGRHGLPGGGVWSCEHGRGRCHRRRRRTACSSGPAIRAARDSR
jgi:ribose-phosphate pyrophosphokinase